MAVQTVPVSVQQVASTHAASKRLAHDEMLHHSESSDAHREPAQKQNQTSDMPKNKSSAPVSATDAGEPAQSSWRPPDTHSATGRISTAMKEGDDNSQNSTHIDELQDDQGRAYYFNRLSGQVGWERCDVETGGGAESDQPSGGAADL